MPRTMTMTTVELQCGRLRNCRMLFSVITVCRALDRHSELICRRINFNWLSIELAAWEFLTLLSHSQLIVLLVNLEAHLHVINAVKI